MPPRIRSAFGLVVLVVALEPTRAVTFTISPIASSALTNRPVSSNFARGHSSHVSGSKMRTSTFGATGLPKRARRRVGRLAHVRAALGRSVPVDDDAPEPLGEPVDVEGRGLVAEREVQRVVGVVRTLGCREDVREGLADVVEERDAVLAHVVQPAACREPAPQHRGRARRHDVREAGDRRVRVEQRHDRVADVVRGEPEVRRERRAPAAQPALAHHHGLRRAGGARREDQHEPVGRRDRDLRQGGARVRARSRRSTRGSRRRRTGRAARPRPRPPTARDGCARSTGRCSRCARRPAPVPIRAGSG